MADEKLDKVREAKNSFYNIYIPLVEAKGFYMASGIGFYDGNECTGAVEEPKKQ